LTRSCKCPPNSKT